MHQWKTVYWVHLTTKLLSISSTTSDLEHCLLPILHSQYDTRTDSHHIAPKRPLHLLHFEEGYVDHIPHKEHFRHLHSHHPRYMRPAFAFLSWFSFFPFLSLFLYSPDLGPFLFLFLQFSEPPSFKQTLTFSCIQAGNINTMLLWLWIWMSAEVKIYV